MAKKEPIQRRKVLDLGYIELVDMMGEDEDAIVDAARVSMDKSADQYTPEQNKKLLTYLRDHQHSSPFEMVDFKFRIMAPVAVWWHWVRHRHMSANFQSGRYVPFTENKVYRPDDWRIQSKSNKQGSAPGEYLPSDVATLFDAERDALYEKAFDLYNRMLEAGVAREEARLVLPFYAVYYEAIVKMNGSSCINFIALREEATAQWEIQQYAKAMRQILATTHPTVFGGPDRMRKL